MSLKSAAKNLAGMTVSLRSFAALLLSDDMVLSTGIHTKGDNLKDFYSFQVLKTTLYE